VLPPSCMSAGSIHFCMRHLPICHYTRYLITALFTRHDTLRLLLSLYLLKRIADCAVYLDRLPFLLCWNRSPRLLCSLYSLHSHWQHPSDSPWRWPSSSAESTATSAAPAQLTQRDPASQSSNAPRAKPSISSMRKGTSSTHH
jgi:hypothetical protein